MTICIFCYLHLCWDQLKFDTTNVIENAMQFINNYNEYILNTRKYQNSNLFIIHKALELLIRLDKNSRIFFNVLGLAMQGQKKDSPKQYKINQ